MVDIVSNIDRAIQQYEEREYEVKKSVESGINLARVTGQKINLSSDELFVEAQRLEQEVAKVGWKGLLYIQLHLGNIALYPSEDYVIPIKNTKLIISQDSDIWDAMEARESSYGPEEIDTLDDNGDFEPHVRMAVFNQKGELGHYGQMPFDGKGDNIEDSFATLKRELEIVKPSLDVRVLNFMGILALSAVGYAKDFKFRKIETLVPIMKARNRPLGHSIGTMTLGEGGDVLLSEYDGKPWVYDEQIGIGLSVGLTD